MSQPKPVAIIGAGLSGLTLSLALHQQGIKSIVYESRPAPMNIGGAIMLSPNALRILDTLGIYQPVKAHGYNFDSLEFRTTTEKLIDSYDFGSESKYGYQASRIYRHELIDIILQAVRAADVQVMYGKKFSRVVEETDDDVTFEFSDGATATVSALIGADGIHSSVRKYLYPGSDHAPRFIGMAGYTGSGPASNLPQGVTVDKPITIVSKTHGAFVVAPQKVDGSEMFFGKMRRIPEDPTREEWDAIHADKKAAIEFLRHGNEVFGEIATNITKDIRPETLNIWPFYVVPKLENWASEKRHVVLVGDAAHAIPPSAGQGINQAFEDVYMLALLLTAVSKQEANIRDALTFWQEFRQARVSKVLELNGRVDQRRLPKGEDEPEVSGEEWDLGWLYNIDIQRSVDEWIIEQSKN